MNLLLPSLYLCLFISLAEAFILFFWTEESSTATSFTETWEVYPQDNTDADTIVRDGNSEIAFASILPYREKIRRMTIIRQIGSQCGADYIPDEYVPQQPGTTPFKDLVYALTKHESMVLGGYLQVFFERRDETRIIMAMILTKNMQEMITTYDNYHSPKTFKDLRKDQKKPFENLLRVWVRDNRESNEKGNLDKNLVTQDVNSLRCEYDCGGWKEQRDELEKVLIKKSFKHAQAVLDEFERAVGKSLENILIEKSGSDELNHDLADAYISLSSYIKYKPEYIANILHQYSDGTDKWTSWIMCIAVMNPKDWEKIDEAFQNKFKDSLSNFILKKMSDDKIMAEIIAVMVNPKFKPTTFVEKPIEECNESDTTPPPTSPTTIAPNSPPSTPSPCTPTTTPSPCTPTTTPSPPTPPAKP